MNIKLILIAVIVGLISVGGGLAAAWFTKPAEPVLVIDPDQPLVAQTQESFLDTEVRTAYPVSDKGAQVNTMTERQLKDLVYDVRQKMEDYDDKLQMLTTREQRLQQAHGTLKKDINRLDNLRVDLVSIVNKLKQQRDILIQNKIEIDTREKTNLITIAATYDKMDAASAGKILTNMTKIKKGNENSLDDAVKILHFMGDRTKAKLLGEMVNTEPKLAAILCKRLKHISFEGQ